MVLCAAFILASAATYLLNDLLDRAKDQKHPVKKLRPIASGELPAHVAYWAVLVLFVSAFAIGIKLGKFSVLAIGAYVLIGTAYSAFLKRIPGLDILGVAACYVTRAAAGGAPSGIHLSGSFIIFTALVATFVVAGKRYDELGDLNLTVSETRPALTRYTPEVLRNAWLLSGVASVVVYAWWVSERGAKDFDVFLYVMSTLLFATTIGQYGLSIVRGVANSPEDVLYSNRRFQLTFVCWLLVAAGAIGQR